MVYLCGAVTADGTPCEKQVSRPGGRCPQHQPITSGAYTKHLPDDISDRVRELLEMTRDTRDEEALVRWMLQEYLDAYAAGTIGREQLYTALLAGVETLSRATERREKVALAKDRAITPQELIAIIALLGDIVQRRVSNLRERQLVAADFAALIQGHLETIRRFPGYPYKSIPADAEPTEIVANALSR